MPSSIFSLPAFPTLILASASPRRAHILETAGVPFTVAPPDATEPPPTPEDELAPQQYVERLAKLKAQGCDLQKRKPLHNLPDTGKILVLAADTIVWHENRILSKPKDADEAVRMLQRLRDQTHTVFTGICLRVWNDGAEEYSAGYEATRVTFGHVSDGWISRYVKTGEPLDKAGAYAAQGRGALLIDRIEGDFWNVVGLPIARVARMLAKAGAPVEAGWEISGQ